MKKMNHKIFKYFLFLLACGFLVASCAVSENLRKRKDCDCPSWSNLKPEQFYDDQGSI